MGKYSTARYKKRVDASRYVNVDTGETLISEFGNVSTIITENDEYVKFKSESFVIIEDEVLNYLSKIMTDTEMNYIRKLTTMVRGNMNFLHGLDNTPHNKETLANDLNLARNAFGRLVNRLKVNGVIYMLSGFLDNQKVQYILLNPNIARRGNYMHKDCVKYFQTYPTRHKR